MSVAVPFIFGGLLFVLGAIIGSFLTVVVARIPAGESIVRPRSACPVCGREIAWFDNIPVASWVLLSGRCRHCQTPIPKRYPMLEAGTGLVFLLLGASAWWGSIPLEFLPAALVIAASGVALSVIDVEHRRLPNPIVYTTYPLALTAITVGLIVSGEWNRLSGAAVGALVWVGVIGGSWLLTRGRGMGLGDVKLAPLLGGSLGIIGGLEAAAGLLFALVLGASVGIVLLATGRVGRRQAIAFGPFLLAGWLIAILVGAPVVDAYLDLVLAVGA